jgi:DNA-binding transcriptional MerR regulator
MASIDSTLFSRDDISLKSDKSPSALRTISEASEALDVPQHVLRFWETKFPQIKPLKRNGGRRFYRPQDLDILQQIKHLLYNQGYTIKGAKKAVNDYLVARTEGAVDAREWLVSLPPANVNDNKALALDSAWPEERAASEDILAEISHALQETVAEVDTPQNDLPRDELMQLRHDLLAARQLLQAVLDKQAA